MKMVIMFIIARSLLSDFVDTPGERLFHFTA